MTLILTLCVCRLPALARTADYGDEPDPPAEVRYARVLYVVSPAARGVVERARGLLPAPAAGRVEVRSLPEGALP